MGQAPKTDSQEHLREGAGEAARHGETPAPNARETTVKASAGGVVATAAAIGLFSPAGFGAYVSDSLALGIDPDGGQANASAFGQVLSGNSVVMTGEEMSDVQAQLAQAVAAIDAAQAATDAEIERLRAIAAHDDNAIPFANEPATRET